MPRPPADDRDRTVAVEFDLVNGQYLHNGTIYPARRKGASITVIGPVSAVGSVLFAIEGSPQENRPIILESGKLRGLCTRHLRKAPRFEPHGQVCPGCLAEMKKGVYPADEVAIETETFDVYELEPGSNPLPFDPQD